MSFVLFLSSLLSLSLLLSLLLILALSLLIECSHLIRRRYQRVPGRKTRIIESIVSYPFLPQTVQLTIKSLSPVHHHHYHRSLFLLPSCGSRYFSVDVERSIIPLIRRVRASTHPSRRIFNYLNAEPRRTRHEGYQSPLRDRGGFVEMRNFVNIKMYLRRSLIDRSSLLLSEKVFYCYLSIIVLFLYCFT